MVYLLLGNGFEEAEAVIPCDLLRRAGVEVRTVGLNGPVITGGHGISLVADCAPGEMDPATAEMVILPGGLGGVRSIRACPEALEAVRAVHGAGGYVAAICAAPTVLAELGLTEGRRATCYPGMEPEMGNARMCADGAVTDGKLITGKAAGTAFDFALALISALRGGAAAETVARAIFYSDDKGGNHV